MARTVKDDRERERRIIMVGEYVMNTGSSTRKTATYFTEIYFPISNYTVSDYCARYCKMNPEDVDVLRGKINANKAQDINQEGVKKRVMLVTELFENGLNVEQISEKLEQDFWVIYRDLRTRLPLIDNERYEQEIKPRLIEHSMENLKHRSK